MFSLVDMVNKIIQIGFFPAIRIVSLNHNLTRINSFYEEKPLRAVNNLPQLKRKQKKS